LFEDKGVIKEKFKVKLQPLTPIHVWSGNYLFEGIDAVAFNDQLFIIDYDKLMKGLSPDEIQSFAEELKKKRSLPERFANLDKLKSLSFETVKIRGDPSSFKGKKIYLNDKLLLPGSELKGFLRTALTYERVKEYMDEGRGKAISFFHETIDLGIIENAKTRKKAAEKLENNLLRAKRPQEKSDKERSEEGGSEERGGFFDLFSFLSVSDPVNEKASLSAVEFFVIKADNSLKRIASIPVIAYDAGTSVFTAAIMKPVELEADRVSSYEQLKWLQDLLEKADRILTREYILESLKFFGSKLIENELSRTERINRKELESYRKKLEEFRNLNNREKNCSVGRIGFMTGHQSKTILPLIYEADSQFYGEITRRLGGKRRWDSLTLKLVKFGDGYLGTGWCRICVEP